MTAEYFASDGFKIEEVIEGGNKAAAFERFSYRSKSLDKPVSSPFAIFLRVENGKVVYFQYMEDTYGTAASLRTGGEARFRLGWTASRSSSNCRF